MGNTAISRNVQECSEKHHGTAGHLQLWQIRSGISVKTKERVSVWTFDKAELGNANRKGGVVADKAVQEQIYAIMLKDMRNMQEASCAGVLRVMEVIQEDKSALAFVTEPVLCSLGDLLHGFDVVPDGLRTHASVFGAQGVLSEMEISRGLGQVVEALQTLHQVHRRLHLGLTPESIVLTPEGKWRLCSFGFSLCCEVGESSRVASPYFLRAMNSGNSRVRLEPDLRYLGPEVTAGGLDPPGIRYMQPTTDVFALGVLFYEAYKYNLKLALERRPHLCTMPLSGNSAMDHPNALTSLSNMDVNFLPHGLASLLQAMMASQTHLRITTADIGNHSYFNTGNLAVLRTVDALPSRDVGTLGTQLQSLVSQLGDFPERLLVSSVLPAICLVTNQNAALWVYAIPLHQTIRERVGDKLAFRNAVQDCFAAGLGVINPVETMQAFLRAVNFVRESFEATFFETNVINKLLVNCFDKDHIPLKCHLFSVLCEKKVHSVISSGCMLGTVIPKACREACKNSDSNVKVHALYFLSHILDRMDKAYVAANLLPSLKYITEKDKAPPVTMTVIGIYEALSEHLGAEYISSSILPTIQPFLMDRTLDVEQFTICANLVKQLMKRVLELRCKELGVDLNTLTGDSHANELSGKFDYFSTARKQVENTATNVARERTERRSSVNANPGGLKLPPAPTSAPPPPPTSAPPSVLPSLPPGPAVDAPQHVFKLAGDASKYRYDPNVSIVGSTNAVHISASATRAADSLGADYSSSSYKPQQSMAPLMSPPALSTAATPSYAAGAPSTYSPSSYSAPSPSPAPSSNGSRGGAASFGMDDIFGSLGGGSGNVGIKQSSNSYGNASQSQPLGGGGAESIEDQIRRTRMEIEAAQAKLKGGSSVPKSGVGMSNMNTGGSSSAASGGFAFLSQPAAASSSNFDPFGSSSGSGSGNGNGNGNMGRAGGLIPPPPQAGGGGFAFMSQQAPSSSQMGYGINMGQGPGQGQGQGAGYGMGQNTNMMGFNNSNNIMNTLPGTGNGMMGMSGMQQQQQQPMYGMQQQQHQPMNMNMGIGMGRPAPKDDPFDFLS